MCYEKADNHTYGTSPQDNRYKHLFRQVRRAIADVAGQGGTNYKGTRREEWSAETNNRGLGERTFFSSNRPFSVSCQNLKNLPPKSFTERITLENKGKKNFENFSEFSKSPLDNSVITGYNIEHNGLPKSLTSRTSLVTNLL
jgi:hypothetical protein